VAFGTDASHGYERIHMHALHSVARLVRGHALSPVEINRDSDAMGSLAGFTEAPVDPADEESGDGRDEAPERPSGEGQAGGGQA